MASTPASVSALLKPRANIGRNAFPLDHRQVFSIKAGQITPVKALKFVPNDHFSIDVSEFGITMPMNTAPFLRGRKETVFYSVYNSAVWSLFNQYIAQRSDPKTSVLNQNLKEPRIALWDLYKFALAQLRHYFTYKISIPYYVRKNHANDTISEDKLNDLIYLERESYLNTAVNGVFSHNWVDPYGFGVIDVYFDLYYNKIDSSLSYYPNLVNPTSSGITIRDFCQDIVGQFRCFNVLRKLDMLGYGNLVLWFKELLSTSQLFLDELDLTDDIACQAFVANCNGLFGRLLNNLIACTVTFSEYASGSTLPTQTADIFYKYENLYPICGYNLIFYHFFRNSFYDVNYNPRDFNLDFVSNYLNEGDNELNIVYITNFSCRFLDIEYHQWKKDQFTGVLPDTQFGAVSSLSFNGVTSSDYGRWRDNLDNGLLPGYNSANIVSDTSRLALTSPSHSIKHDHTFNASFDVIALKRAEILQDYRQTLMRAGNKTSDVFKALYGGAPSSEHEDDIIPRFLDTFGTDIFIDPVTATANTEQGNNGTLGDLSARGKFSGNSGKISFNSGNNFGILFCLTYFVPSSEYNSYFLDPANSCLNPEDHYISNFENMGLEPIYSDELNSLRPRKDLAVLGYAPRYHFLKSQLDVVHGEFASLPPNMRLGVPSSSVFDNARNGSLGFNGVYNIWVAPRTDMQNRGNTQLRDFYINPSILDNLFVQAVDAEQSSDNFIVNMYLDIKATRGMSKVGLLNFV